MLLLLLEIFTCIYIITEKDCHRKPAVYIFIEIVGKYLFIEIEKHVENDSPFTLNFFEIMIPQSSNISAECLISRINKLINSYHQVTWKIVHGKYRVGYLCGFEYCWWMGSVLLCTVGLESEVQVVSNGNCLSCLEVLWSLIKRGQKLSGSWVQFLKQNWVVFKTVQVHQCALFLKRNKADIKPHLWLTCTVQLQHRQMLNVTAVWLNAVPWEEYLWTNIFECFFTF